MRPASAVPRRDTRIASSRAGTKHGGTAPMIECGLANRHPALRGKEWTPVTIRVGINGLGRIGRNFFRALLASDADVTLVGFNDLGDVATIGQLLKYDTVLGRLPHEV